LSILQNHTKKIVIIATTSEGVPRARIGRHRWAELTPMWNMSKESFKELHERISGSKPSFEDIWKLTGGNTDMLRRLYQSNWSAEPIIERIIRVRKT
jgi:hypothetical protein